MLNKHMVDAQQILAECVPPHHLRGRWCFYPHFTETEAHEDEITGLSSSDGLPVPDVLCPAPPPLSLCNIVVTKCLLLEQREPGNNLISHQ